MTATGKRLALLALALAAGAAATAAPGVTENTITFGQSGCFSGTCRNSGLQYRAGILAAFHERNQKGGVIGRELVLVSRDDGYEPQRAAANANWFVDTNEVFAVVGGVGTPTAERMAPTFREAMIPFVGHLTGAEFLGDAGRFPNVVNVRTGYPEETRQMVAHMFEEYNARRFGIIYQDDAFGRSVLASYKSALDAFDLPILAKAAYSRHTHAVHSSVFVMDKAELDAVMLATTIGPAAQAINTARSLGHEYVVGLLSFVDSERLERLLDYSSEKVLLTRVTPSVTDERVAIVRRFRHALAAYRNAEPEAVERVVDALALEGYIVGRFVIEVLERMQDELSRKVFLSTALAPEPVFIDDWVIAFDEGGNVGSDYVRLTSLAGYDSTKEAAE